ncbi:MAG: hypothetical protein ACI8TX_001814 [Hyphomicrobiaceae bacterium]|jgi:hypothetical protein
MMRITFEKFATIATITTITTITTIARVSAAIFVAMLFVQALPVGAAIEVPGLGGILSVDGRARASYADIDGFDESEAFTLRLRVGYMTPTVAGFSVFAELESLLVADDDSYFDAVSAPNGESLIADPEDTDLNRLSLQYTHAEGLLHFVGGRQRIKLDDDRFVGNVGWRQNEQTYDAALVESSLGVDDLKLTYAYIWDVNRIFGDQGPAGTRDFDSETHLVRLGFDRFAWVKLAAFAYLMDFENSPQNSADTYGLRAVGDLEATDTLSFAYQASVAHQVDAGDNSKDYSANYLLGDVAARVAEIGAFGVGCEVLGSDDGEAVFVTPLATAHKFNGFADAFLNNGGTDGLRDFYVYIAPKLPCGLKGKVAWHSFEADHGDDALGNEYDGVISRKFGEHFNVLAKVAYYESDGTTGPADRFRGTLDVEFGY